MPVAASVCSKEVREMSWISPTFGDGGGSSAPTPKRRKTTNHPEIDHSDIITATPSVSKSNWLEKYCPRNVDDLAVHVKKLKELESWLEQCTKSSSKCLLLKGPSGCCKTTAVQVLCRKLDFTIREWITPLDRPVEESEMAHKYEFNKSTAAQFEEYLFRSSRYGSCLNKNPKKQLVIVKDFPNVFIHNPATFHETLEKILHKCISPIVFICSDESLCRKLFPVTFLTSCVIQTITFNPITDQRMFKVLKNILQQESKINKNMKLVPDESLHSICSACQGDLRSAIYKLNFCTISSKYSISNLKSVKKVEKGKTAKENTPTDKDRRLDFFHGIGRVLYPKKIESEKGLRFVHSTVDIVDTFLCEPKTFINQLYENYPGKLGNVHDLSNAAGKLSISDILISRWQEKDIFSVYSLSVAVQGLMVSNKNPEKAKFEAFKKSQTSRVEIDSKSLQMEGKRVFSNLCVLDYGTLLDILPFSQMLLPDLNQAQIEYVQRTCRFR